MANTFLTPSVIANEALMVLQANLVMADLVHRDYSAEFVNVGDTITVRKPATFVARNFTGQTTAQDATEGSVTVKMDRFRDVTAKVTSKQMTLDIKDFSFQIVQPAMRAISQAVDEDLLASAVQYAGATVAATASPANLADIAGVAKRLDLNKVPMDNRRLVLHPTHKYNYALTDNLSKVSYAGDNNTLRDALLGKIYTMDTYMDQNAPDTAAATTGSATAYKVSGAAGESKVALSALSGATATVKTGDAFVVDGYLYRFAADGTGASSAIAEIAIDQPLHKTLSAVDAVVIAKPHSVGFHRNGMALVTRNLALPMGAANAAIASADGLGVRVVYGYDMTTKTDTVSFDILYGVAKLDDKMIVKLA